MGEREYVVDAVYAIDAVKRHVRLRDKHARKKCNTCRFRCKSSQSDCHIHDVVLQGHGQRGVDGLHTTHRNFNRYKYLLRRKEKNKRVVKDKNRGIAAGHLVHVRANASYR